MSVKIPIKSPSGKFFWLPFFILVLSLIANRASHAINQVFGTSGGCRAERRML